VEESSSNSGDITLVNRFNGATAMKPWKSTKALGKVVERLKLQWGHGDEAVEEGSP